MKNSATIVLVSVVAAAAGFGLYYYSTRDDSAVAVESAPAEVTASKEADVSMPTKIPDVSLENREGKKQSLNTWAGKSMIVNFWATWCAPCRKEIPLLMAISKNKAKDNFQVVGIAIDFRDEVIKYADEIKIDYPLLIGEQDGVAAAEAFGISNIGLPFTAFGDNQGRIVTLLMGELTEAKADVILSNVERVNKGELTPEAARAAIAAKLQKMKKEV